MLLRSGIFRGTEQLSNLITDSDLATILGKDFSSPLWAANPQPSRQRNERGEFVQDASAQRRSERIRDFRTMLNISEWNIGDFMEALKTKTDTVTEWMMRKSDGWHQSLYVLLGDFLSNAPSRPNRIAIDRKSKLSSLCIVPCGDGAHRIGGECYFPSDGVERDEVFPRVVQGVYSSGNNKQEQEKARKFLEDIGVSDVGEADRIETILKQRYSQTAVDNDNFCPEIVTTKPGL